MSEYLSIDGKRIGVADFTDEVAATAKNVDIRGTSLTALPAMDAATDVWIINNPGLTALPAMDAATFVRIINNPGLAALPAMDSAIDVRINDLKQNQ